LTDAVVDVYGDWARDIVVVHLDGLPKGRWGIGGRAVDDAAPAVTFGIREDALTRPDGKAVAARLVAGATDAVASVLGEQTRSGTSVELVASPEGPHRHRRCHLRIAGRTLAFKQVLDKVFS
jgi:phenylpyruvate tautomerase PptA (4-oxalocrotonate tautomerase family)